MIEILDQLCNADQAALREELAKCERRAAIIRAILGERKPGPGVRKTEANSHATPPAARKSTPPPAEEAEPAADAPPVKERIAKFLQYAGPKRIDAIAREIGTMSSYAIMKLMESSTLFEKSGVMWTLSSEGHAKFRKED